MLGTLNYSVGKFEIVNASRRANISRARARQRPRLGFPHTRHGAAMFHLTATPGSTRGPLSRRHFLKAGMLGIGGLSLADVYRAQANAAAAGGPTPPGTSV